MIDEGWLHVIRRVLGCDHHTICSYTWADGEEMEVCDFDSNLEGLSVLKSNAQYLSNMTYSRNTAGVVAHAHLHSCIGDNEEPMVD